MTRTALRVALALTAFTAGCGKKTDGSSGSTSTTSSAPSTKPAPKVTSGPEKTEAKPEAKTESKKATPPAPSGPRGRAAAGNNPALVDLAAKAEACKVDAMYPGNSCRPEVNAFVAAFDPAKDLATLANLLEDPAPNVRFLATRVLLEKMLLQTAEGRRYGARIAAAAAAETDPTTATVFGGALLQGDFKDAAFADAVGTMFESHPLPAMRIAIASNLGVQDPPDRWVAKIIARYAVETDHAVKVAIVGGLYLARHPKVCPFLLEVMKDPDNELAGVAGYGLVWSDGKCKDHYDAFLDAYAAHVKVTKPDYQFALKVKYMAKAKGATDAQKAKFAETTRTVIADTAVTGMARATLLEAIGDKAFAKGFVGDKDTWVADAAKRLQK